MPRAPSKRAAASAAASEPQPKKAKSSGAASGAASEEASSAAASTSAPAPAPVPKSKRWSAVSASRNADHDFKVAVQDPERANAFICICPPSFANNDEDEEDEDSDDDEEDDEEDDDDEEEDDDDDAPKSGKKPKQKCDGGETCLCKKPANENPEHDWIVSYAGFRKWIAQDTMSGVRCPDFFSMYTFNDHSAYGTLEVIENLMLDWVEAGTWREQWAVCEGLVFFGLGQGGEFCMQVVCFVPSRHMPINLLTMTFSHRIDDGEQAGVVAELIGRLFLTMLSRLEAKDLLADVSDVKNLGLIMALYIKLAATFRAGSLIEGSEKDKVYKPTPFTWTPSKFDDYINGFATKYGITLRGLPDMDDMTADLETDVRLPADEAAWGWDKTFKKYSKRYARSPPMGGGKAKIGGDNFDITAWSSAERKKYSFDKKDPFSKKDLDALKTGMVMSVQMM